MLTNWPPLKLAQLAILGSFVVALEPVSDLLGDGFLSLHDHFFHSHNGPLTIAACILIFFAPLILGGFLILQGKSRLSNGLKRGDWTESQIEASRLWVESLALRRVAEGLLWIYAADWLVCSALRYLWKVHLNPVASEFLGSLWFFPLPFWVLQSLRKALRPQPPSFDPSRATRPKPLRSNHWGQPKSPSPGAAQP